jgi:hypothetical protein
MLILIIRTFISALRSHRALALENLALRHQLDTLKRNTKRPCLKNRDRATWVLISRLWEDWRKPLTIVQPDTVIRWHRKGFKLYWRWKSRPRDTAPKYLLRDRDGIFGGEFIHRIESMGIEQVFISARSPWQNPYVERIIGSIRRECLDHTIIFSEKHLRRVLKEYFKYYHGSRTHLGLGKDCPNPRPVEPPDVGPISTETMVGGLHHRYYRKVA